MQGNSDYGVAFAYYAPSKKLAIEYQGIQHIEPIHFFGMEIAFQHRIKLDEIKQKSREEWNKSYLLALQ